MAYTSQDFVLKTFLFFFLRLIMTALLLFLTLQNTLEKLKVCAPFMSKKYGMQLLSTYQTYGSAAQRAVPQAYRANRLKHIQASTHLMPLLQLPHLFPDVCDPGIVHDKAVFSSHSLEQKQAQLLLLSYADLPNPKPRFVCLPSYRSP